jgi:amidase
VQRITTAIRTNYAETGTVPAATVDSGEVFQVASTSFTEGYSYETMPQLVVEQAVAPLTAPIIVTGAQPGDVLRVDVIELRFTRDFGCVLLLPGRGVFPSLTQELYAKPVRITDDEVIFSDALRIPTRKMLGKVSVAPAGEPVHSSSPGHHGGNLDNRDIGRGSSVYLPVNVEGAHLGIGDAHAVQGDGEIGISAVEVEMESVVRATVIKDLDLRVPVVRSGGHVMTMGVGQTLDEAAREALDEMHRLLKAEHGLDDRDTAMFMSMACDVHVSQLVNPLVGIKAKIPEHLLPLP